MRLKTIAIGPTNKTLLQYRIVFFLSTYLTISYEMLDPSPFLIMSFTGINTRPARAWLASYFVFLLKYRGQSLPWRSDDHSVKMISKYLEAYPLPKILKNVPIRGQKQ